MTLGEGFVLSNRYRLDRRIATGGMGEVWHAVDTRLGRVVAVKVLKPEYVDDGDFLQRFRAEARHAAGLSHPGIATVFDYGEVDDAQTGAPGTAYLVMEFVDGLPLSRVLSTEGRLEPARALDIVAQSAAALHAAHLAGVIHRDVKPGNIMIRRDGVVKITDFGIARASDGVPLTQTGTVLGTAYYLSPEQASAQPTTAASDVYSLGVVLYEMLAGRRPFTGGNPLQVAMMHTRDAPPPLPGDVPEPVAALTAQMMARDPLQRPESAGALGLAAARLADQVRTGRLPDDATAVLPRSAAGAGIAPTVPPAVSRARTQVYRPAPPADGTRVMPPVDSAPAAQSAYASGPPRRRSGRTAFFVTVGLLVVIAVVAGLLKLAADDGQGRTVTIPQVVGENVDKATADLTGLGLKVDTKSAANPDVPADQVISSNPTQGSPATKGDLVTLTFSGGSNLVSVKAADYIGRPFDAVRSELEDLGLQVTPNYVQATDADQVVGTVAGLNPTGSLKKNSPITVDVVNEASPSPSPSATTASPTPSAGSPSSQPSSGPPGPTGSGAPPSVQPPTGMQSPGPGPATAGPAAAAQPLVPLGGTG